MAQVEVFPVFLQSEASQHTKQCQMPFFSHKHKLFFFVYLQSCLI